ncbi:MAG: MATE family efflux transporter, partial [Succinivibrio dextrinosolvens]|nr:MATE family efflux transporter [Succinivibrio dextrinosolvens]
TTFIGQNFGAKNIRRCVEIAKVSSLIGLIVTTVITAVVYFFAKPLLSMYTVSEAVISIAMIRIFYVLLPQPINIFLEVLSGSMRGYGFSLPPTIITLLTICSCRLLYVFTVFEKFTSFDVLMMVYPLSWVICIVFLVVMYIYKIRKVEKEYSRLYKSKKA